MAYLSHTHTHSLTSVWWVASPLKNPTQLKSSGGLYLTLLQNLVLFIAMSNISPQYEIASCTPLIAEFLNPISPLLPNDEEENSIFLRLWTYFCIFSHRL